MSKRASRLVNNVTDEEKKLYEGRINPPGAYLGKRENDEAHLGGCAILGDAGTYYPIMWQEIIRKFEIKSMIDVGCGVGWSTKWFKDNGCTVRGIEGLQEAIDASPVKKYIRKHDYERDGPYIPVKYSRKNYDLSWSCEFVEHVNAESAGNFIHTFKSAKYVAMTYAEPGQGGHHHVNCQPEIYWIKKLEANGFIYDKENTEYLREFAKKDKEEWGVFAFDERVTHPKHGAEIPKVAPWYCDFHFIKRGLFFVREQD